MEIGLVLAIVCSIAYAILDGVRKKILEDVDPVLMAGLIPASTGLITGAAALHEGLALPESSTFWWASAGSGLLNLVAHVLYMRAIKASPLSLTVPYLALSPALLMMIAWFALDERPGALGVVGVLLVTAGTYVLNTAGAGPLAPLRAILKEPGSWMMATVAVLWSVTSTLDKTGILNGPLLVFATSTMLISGVPLLIYMAFTRPSTFMDARRIAPLITFSVLLFTGALAAQFLSYESLLVSYTIAIKRAGTFLTVVIGLVVYRETGLARRLPGSALMVGGVVLIVLEP